MKTFIVLSDTHGNFLQLKKVSRLFAEADYVVHLGDFCSDMNEYRAAYPGKVYAVRGNCDGGSDSLVIESEGCKIFLTHGHTFNVKRGLVGLKEYAEENGFDAVLYGHTHTPAKTVENGITYVNPGTMEKWDEPTYCFMAAHNGKITAKIVKLL